MWLILAFLSAALLAEFQVQLFEYGFRADFGKKLGHLQGLDFGKPAVAGDMGEKKSTKDHINNVYVYFQ